MLAVASAFWFHPPLIYLIVPWTAAGIACSMWGRRAFGTFFGASGAVLIAMMFVISNLPDLGGEWPRDEGFFWWAMLVYFGLALIVCGMLAAITERSRRRRHFGLSEEFE